MIFLKIFEKKSLFISKILFLSSLFFSARTMDDEFELLSPNSKAKRVLEQEKKEREAEGDRPKKRAKVRDKVATPPQVVLMLAPPPLEFEELEMKEKSRPPVPQEVQLQLPWKEVLAEVFDRFPAPAPKQASSSSLQKKTNDRKSQTDNFMQWVYTLVHRHYAKKWEQRVEGSISCRLQLWIAALSRVVNAHANLVEEGTSENGVLREWEEHYRVPDGADVKERELVSKTGAVVTAWGEDYVLNFTELEKNHPQYVVERHLSFLFKSRKLFQENLCKATIADAHAAKAAFFAIDAKKLYELCSMPNYTVWEWISTSFFSFGTPATAPFFATLPPLGLPGPPCRPTVTARRGSSPPAKVGLEIIPLYFLRTFAYKERNRICSIPAGRSGGTTSTWKYWLRGKGRRTGICCNTPTYNKSSALLGCRTHATVRSMRRYTAKR